jgi:hypothetical protein
MVIWSGNLVINTIFQESFSECLINEVWSSITDDYSWDIVHREDDFMEHLLWVHGIDSPTRERTLLPEVPKHELQDWGHSPPKHSNFSDHLDVVEGSDPHPWRTDNGKAQPGAPGLQKGELLKLLLALPLKLLSPQLSIDYSVEQATGVVLGHLSSPTRFHELTLEKGDLLSKALGILMSRS